MADKLKPIFEEHRVVLAYLFGSQARGESGPYSDVDIAVVFGGDISPRESFERRLKMGGEIARVLGVPDADVIDLIRAAGPLIKHNAVFTGQPILVTDDELRFAVERAVVREYENTKPLRRIASLVLKAQLKDGTFGKPLARA